MFAQTRRASGRAETAPLGESGGEGQLVMVVVLEMALRRKMVVDRGELLKRLHAPEPQHGTVTV